MTRILLIITASFIALMATGCVEPAGGGAALSTPEGLAAYLGTLPAVENVSEWRTEEGEGLIITTAHYEIRTTLLDPLMLRQVPGFVESAYRAYQSQLPEPIETKTRFVTLLFADRKQWEDFTRGFAGANADVYLKIRKGAYYLNGACVAYNIGRRQTFSALAHEGWHQFNSKHFAFRLPSWLDEGIATLFEVSVPDDGGFEFLPERNLGRLQSLKKAMRQGRMLSVEELITLNPGQLMGEEETVKGFYAQSYALVRFLREDDYGKRLGAYQRLLLGGLRGTWPLDEEMRRIAADRNVALTVQYNVHLSPKLFVRYIERDFERIDREYLAFCEKNVYHIPSGE